MATKKKTETKELYIDGNRASLKLVYQLLKNEITEGSMNQIRFNTSISKKVAELEKAIKEKRSYSINVIVPETKPWYKRLFGK